MWIWRLLFAGAHATSSDLITAGSLPQECLASGSVACADFFPTVSLNSFNCTAELLKQQQVLGAYCESTVSDAETVADCARLFPCGTCLPHLECPVETCTVQFDGVSPLTCTELETDAEFGCCYQSEIADIFWASESGLSSSFECHNCRFFELPAEERAGEQWVCHTFCLRPTWPLFVKALLQAFFLWLSTGAVTLFAAVLRRAAVSGHLQEVYRQKDSAGFQLIAVQDLLKGSHLFMVVLGLGGLVQAWVVYGSRAVRYKAPIAGAVFEIIYVTFLGVDMLIELAVASLLGVRKAIRTVFSTAVLDALLIASPWALSTVADERKLKTWFTFAFLGALKTTSMWKRWYSVHGQPSSVAQVNMGIFLDMAGYLTAVASLLHVAELIEYSDPLMEPEPDSGYRWKLLDALYLFMITIGSLGFRTLYPRTGLGRGALLTWTVFVLVSIVRVGLSMLKAWGQNALRERSYDSTKDKEYGGRHVLIAGDPDMKFITDALNELFHPEHVHAEALTVVCLLPRPDEKLQLWLRRRENAHLRGRVTVLEGDALREKDLKRAAATDCRAVLIFPKTGAVDPVEEDLKNVARYMSVRRYAWHVSVVLGLHHEDHKAMLDYTVLNGTLEKLNIISLDKFKLYLFAKGCTIPTFVSVMCNLCKSVQVEDEDMSLMEAAEALAQGRRKERWVLEYDQGVGMEIYEAPLSKMYVGRRFPEVAEDIFLRSTPSTVILLGTVEYDMAGTRRLNRRVLINPGKLHVISKEKQVYGIFIAGSSGEIKQSYAQNTLAGLGSLSTAPSTRTSVELAPKPATTRELAQREALVTRAELMKPLESDEEKDELEKKLKEVKAPVWDTKTGDEVRRRRQKLVEEAHATGTLHLVLNLVRMSRIPASLGAKVCGFEDEGRIWDVIGRDDAEILGLPGTATAVSGASGMKVRGLSEFTLKRSTISKLSAWQEETDARRGRLWEQNRRLDLLDAVLRRGEHYLVVILGMTSEASMTGLRHFVHPVRAFEAEDRPIVVLAPWKPADWEAVGEFDVLARSDEELAQLNPSSKDFRRGVYFVQGEPVEEMALELAGVRRAAAVVVHAISSQTDTDTVTLAKRVEGMAKSGDVPVLIELANESQMNFVSKKRKRDRDDTRKIVASDATHCPRFVGGHLYFQSIVHTVSAGLLFNSSLQLVLDSLTAAKFQLVPVTADWDFREYMKLHLELVRRQDLVPIAVHRSQIAEIKKKKNFLIDEFDNLTKYARAVKYFFDINHNLSLREATEKLRKFVGLKPLDRKIPLWDKPEKYTVTGANQDLNLREGDVILCISP